MARATLLFDSASLYFRAFFGLPASLTGRTGEPVNAVRGLLDFLARFITEYRPERVACCWDEAWRPAWRVALVPSYKAHRVASGDVEEVPHDLNRQVPWIRATLEALGLPVVGAPDYEADDVIATLARRADGPVEVVTGDRDLFQLVEPTRPTRVLYVARGVAGTNASTTPGCAPSTTSRALTTSTSPCCAVTPPTGCLASRASARRQPPA
jgi:5'-3' exonuclease